MKNEAIILLGEVYVRVSFLVKYGLSRRSVNNQLSKNRAGKTASYGHFADPGDKRVKWIKYASIPKNSIIKFKLPTVERLKISLDAEENNVAIDLVRQSMFHAYERDYLSFTNNFRGFFHDHDIIEQYARTNALFHCMSVLKKQGYHVNKMFEIYAEFEDVVFQYSSLKSFYNKLSHFEVNGFTVFIHKNYRKAKSHKKITKYHIREIEKQYKKSAMFSVRKITELVNDWAVLNGFQELSISSIKKVVSDPFFQNKNRPFRNGQSWADSNFNSFRLRLNPEHNGTLWQIDGTKFQLSFKNDFGKIVEFVVFFVMDVHSRKIVGYSIAENENHMQIIEALKMAVENTGFLPSEILRDNGGAFNHKKYKALEENMASYGNTYIRKHRVRNPRDKAQVERFNGVLQTCILKGEPSYIGEGITSTRKEGRPSFEVLQSIKKGKDVPHIDERESTVDRLINTYNEFSMSQDEHCPRLKFELAKLDPLASKISRHDFALMFWESRFYDVRQSMIIITEGSRRQKVFQYIIESEHLRLTLNGTAVKVCFNREDRSFIKIYNKNDNWIADIKETPKIKPTRTRINKKPTKTEREVSKSSESENGWMFMKNNRNKLFQEKATMKIFKPNSSENEQKDSNNE